MPPSAARSLVQVGDTGRYISEATRRARERRRKGGARAAGTSARKAQQKQSKAERLRRAQEAMSLEDALKILKPGSVSVASTHKASAGRVVRSPRGRVSPRGKHSPSTRPRAPPRDKTNRARVRSQLPVPKQARRARKGSATRERRGTYTLPVKDLVAGTGPAEGDASTSSEAPQGP